VNVGEVLKLALRHYHAGRLADAERLYRQVLAADPNHADALHLLGLVAHRVGRHEDAATLIGRAIRVKPTASIYHHNLGEALRMRGRTDDAIAAYRRAIELQPDLAPAHVSFGIVLSGLRQFPLAVSHLRRATELRPDDSRVWNTLGETYRAQGQFDDAERCFREAIRVSPDLADAHLNLAKVLHARGDFAGAAEACESGLQRAPNDAAAHVTMGNILLAQGRLSESLAEYQTALQLRPDTAEIYFNLGNVLRLRGEIVESLAAYEKGVQLRPDIAAGHSAMLGTLHYDSSREPPDVFERHVAWGRRHETPHAALPAVHVAPRGDRRLRVGYVSPDFRRHVIAYFIEPLLEYHDRDRFEIFCYADLLRAADDVTTRLQRHADTWRNVTALSDDELAAQVRADGIDVLIDLAGHTADNRLLAFARRPAPVQATYLGYPGTTGMPAIDVRITDALADPPGMTESLHTERLQRLAGCAWCYRPRDDAPPVALRQREDGRIVLGSFNALPKISAATVDVWAQLLRAVPEATLLIKAAGFEDAAVRTRMAERFAAHGVDAGRIELLAATGGFVEHLAAYGRVDVALDTFPYNGTTTTCEALWMGVPTIALAGRTHASRVGVSLLTHAGLPELVASSPEEFVRVGTELSRDGGRLAEVRRTMRERLRASRLLDARAFARDFEAAIASAYC
jgi:protein O-GlcNAc transferase